MFSIDRRMTQEGRLKLGHFNPIPVEIHFQDKPTKIKHTIAVYNPSRVYPDSDGQLKCLVRVEESPYSPTGYSAVHEASVTVTESGGIYLSVERPFVEPRKNIVKTEDPWIGQLPDGGTAVSWVNYDGNVFWQVLACGDKLVELPEGMKGTRFFPLGEKVVIFARPKSGKLTTSDGSFVVTAGSEIGYLVIETRHFSVYELPYLLQTEQFRLLQLNSGDIPAGVWWGINELIQYGYESFLLYHSGRYEQHRGGKRKIYYGHLSRLMFEEGSVVICRRSPTLNISRADYPYGPAKINQLEELHDVVYPSGFYKDENRVLILGGNSDFSVCAFELHVGM